MGRESNRKKQKREERAADARKFRIVVCAYPDKTLLPVLELLKAATVYGDEVVLHHPTATMLASVAAIGELGSSEFVNLMRTLAPALGEEGASFEKAMTKLEADHGSESLSPLIGALLDPSSALHQVLPIIDAVSAKSLADSAREVADLRQSLDSIIEQQLEDAGVGQLMPAIDAGLLRLSPMEDREDFFDAYLRALWSVLKDGRYYPLLDAGMAKIVDAAVREGMFDPPKQARSRGRQAGAASEFLARLPSFPRATMEERSLTSGRNLRRPSSASAGRWCVSVATLTWTHTTQPSRTRQSRHGSRACARHYSNSKRWWRSAACASSSALNYPRPGWSVPWVDWLQA